MFVLTFDLVEGLGDEGLDGFEALHHEAQRGELAAAVGDELIGQRCREDLLQTHGLEAREGRPCGRRERERAPEQRRAPSVNPCTHLTHGIGRHSL